MVYAFGVPRGLTSPAGHVPFPRRAKRELLVIDTNNWTAEDRQRRLDAADAVDERDRICDLLRQLSRRQRELLLCLRIGLSLNDAARILGIQRSTAKRYLSRIRSRVRAVGVTPF